MANNLPVGLELRELRGPTHSCGSRAVYIDQRSDTAFGAGCGRSLTDRITDAISPNAIGAAR
jgi:hypothetical protein